MSLKWVQDNSPKNQLTQNFLGQLTQFSGQFTQFSGQLTQTFWSIHPNKLDDSPKYSGQLTQKLKCSQRIT